MRCCMDASRFGAVNDMVVGQAALTFCAAATEAPASSSSAARCGRLDRLLNQIDRQACNLATVLAAQLRQPVGRVIGAARQQIACEGIVIVRSKHAGVDVIIAVPPEWGTGGTAPDRIVIDVEIREWPEQGPYPSISAVAVSPPSGAAVLPASQRHTSGNPRANVQVL